MSMFYHMAKKPRPAPYYAHVSTPTPIGEKIIHFSFHQLRPGGRLCFCFWWWMRRRRRSKKIRRRSAIIALCGLTFNLFAHFVRFLKLKATYKDSKVAIRFTNSL